MTQRVPRLVVFAAWAVTLAWTVCWGLFRGQFAHGGYVWWENVHGWGLTLLLLLCISITAVRWRTRPILAASALWHVVLQLSMILGVLVSTWLSFQTGLAIHESPDSFHDFFWNEP